MAAEEQTAVITVPQHDPNYPYQPSNKMATNHDDTKYAFVDERSMGEGRGSPGRPVCALIAIFLLLAGATGLVVWLVYRPHKPRFAVVGAAVYELNTTQQPTAVISSAMQFTILVRNPNRRVSLRYDRLVAYVAYRDEAITAQVPLAALRQGKRSTVAVSPVLGGEAVGVSVGAASGLAVEQNYGVVGLTLVLRGRLRWKAGAIKTVHYGLNVKCDVMLALRKGVVGQVPLLTHSHCKLN